MSLADTSSGQCPLCRGERVVRRRVFKSCRQRPCHDHAVHFFKVKCWLCRGSGVDDFVTRSLRYFVQRWRSK
jgi:hypothetical protein